jgi:FkbM family methyltransferase
MDSRNVDSYFAVQRLLGLSHISSLRTNFAQIEPRNRGVVAEIRELPLGLEPRAFALRMCTSESRLRGQGYWSSAIKPVGVLPFASRVSTVEVDLFVTRIKFQESKISVRYHYIFLQTQGETIKEEYMFTLLGKVLLRLRREFLILIVKIIAPTRSEIGLIEFVGRENLSPIALFRLDGWNEVLYAGLDLNAQDSVCVLGAYLGDSIHEYRNRYDSAVIGLEPISEFCTSLGLRFSSDQKVQIVKIGASDRSESVKINLSDDATSLYIEGGRSEIINCVDIVELFESFVNPPYLLEINIEGAEFKVLNRLLDSPFSSSVNTLLIQFHNFVDDSELMRAEIRKRLSQDYVEIFSYPFVWERWDLKYKAADM